MNNINEKLHKVNFEINETEMELKRYIYHEDDPEWYKNLINQYSNCKNKLENRLERLYKERDNIVSHGAIDLDNLQSKIKDILLTMVIDSGRKYQSKKKIK